MTFNEFSADGHARNISNIDFDLKNLYNQKSGQIVHRVDMKPMLFPDIYRLFFYA
ncbi:protein of unknown function [Candidatus Nitrosocosmicus franklandus]|uniref:Uncharacterized protein n=1 Tax=Candidatus Nitrosocosmicus franklandianus TaxID=1798806 RepID=A0A484I752_9ARCH|nr:protein of unknown function [Candidatus Nitrosocosmicus franklandus]